MSRPMEAILKDWTRAEHDAAIAHQVSDQCVQNVRALVGELATRLGSQVGIVEGTVLTSTSWPKGNWRVMTLWLDEWRLKGGKVKPTPDMLILNCHRVLKDGSTGKRQARFQGVDLLSKSLTILISKGGEEHGSAEGRQNAAS